MTKPRRERAKLGAIYARYSSGKQNEESIEQQLEICHDFAQREGIKVVAEYSDYHKSGTTDRRPSFQRMMRHAERGDFDVVIAYKSNRLARNMLNALTYENRLEQYGVCVKYAREEFGDNAAGRFALRTMMNVNQYFSETLSEDVTRAMMDHARDCLANGKPPYGYCKGADGKYAADPQTGPVVRRIFDELAGGARICDVIQALNKECVPTATGRAWSHSSFNRMLDNERYTGVYIYADIRIEGGMPALVPREVYDIVQDKIRQRGHPRGRHTVNGDYLLTGKAYCGHCGSKLVGSSGTGKSGQTYGYYACASRLRGSGCTKTAIRREALERRVAELARDIAMDDATIEWIADAAMATAADNDSVARRLDELTARRRDVTAALGNVVRAIEAGIITDTTKQRLQELEAERGKLDDLVARARRTAPKIERSEVIYTLRTFREGDIDDPDFRRALIDSFVQAVYLFDDHIQVDYRCTKGDTRTISAILAPDAAPPGPSCVLISSPPGHHGKSHESIDLSTFSWLFYFPAAPMRPARCVRVCRGCLRAFLFTAEKL